MDVQINKLTNLISDLLDVTKIVGGKMTFAEEKFDFNEVVKEIVDYVQPITDKHKIIVEGKVKYPLWGDRDRTGQVLMNLLSNTVKYSTDNTEIIVHVSSAAKQITCCVEDFGVGIRKIN